MRAAAGISLATRAGARGSTRQLPPSAAEIEKAPGGLAPGAAIIPLLEKTGAKRFWTTREEAVLREHYPTKGWTGCMPLLPGRSEGSIYQHAVKLGLKAPNGFTHPRLLWTWTPQVDAMIVQIYERGEEGAVKRLARTINRPPYAVRQRASKLGVVVSDRVKEPRWSEAEDELVSANAHKHPATIQRVLARAGFKRTETAIGVRRKRLGCGSGRNADPDHLTANQLAKCFGLACAKSVVLWIDKGLLTARRRGTARTETNGGDEWWIHRRAVRRFVIENVARVDFRKVDKVWLVDLLVGQP